MLISINIVWFDILSWLEGGWLTSDGTFAVSKYQPCYTNPGWLAEEREEPTIPVPTLHRVATHHTTQSQCRIEALVIGPGAGGI